MYRVNAERSQEKNDRNGRMQRCTKVTCATRTRRKSSRDITIPSRVFSHHVVPAGRTLQKDASLRDRRDCTSRTFAKLSAIYNKRRLSSDELLEGAQLWPVRMML